MRIVGCTLVANAHRLDFPVVPAIRSILPLCDEVIVNLGPSTDDTRELLLGIADPRVRIIDGAWLPAPGGATLAIETQRVLDAAVGDWALYIQADEVLHEASLEPLARTMNEAHDDPAIEGVLVNYRHFYGSFESLGGNRSWYRREVRALRLGAGVRSHQDAQGFRVGPSLRRLRARPSEALMFHYGWARPLPALREKYLVDRELYGTDRRPLPLRLPWQVGLRRFHGSHPRVAQEWIAERRGRLPEGLEPPVWSARQLQLGLALAIERLSGWRPFEYRNYEVV
jgi:glycosyltransferase involved in cell wall biosynthesis